MRRLDFTIKPDIVKENLPFGRDFNRFSADPPIFVAGQEITL